MPTQIPAARGIIRAVHDRLDPVEHEHERAELTKALGMMRRHPKHNGRTTSQAVTRAVVIEVLAIIRDHPRLTDLEVANLVGRLNPGRVNEIRNGLRTPDNPTMSNDGRNRRKPNADD